MSESGTDFLSTRERDAEQREEKPYTTATSEQPSAYAPDLVNVRVAALQRAIDHLGPNAAPADVIAAAVEYEAYILRPDVVEPHVADASQTDHASEDPTD
jgi:hypothetical protein